MIDLRPHHLLCIQKYSGHGYDEAFTARMDEIVLLLKAEPETKIAITGGRDWLCSACPNCDGTSCLTEEKVQTMDEKVLGLCGVTYGEKSSWAQLAAKAAGIFGSKALEDICGECEWFELCASKVL